MDTTNPFLACMDQISPTLFVMLCIGAVIAGGILRSHHNLTLRETYLAMTGRHKVAKPAAFYVVGAVCLLATFGYFAYAYQTICVAPG